MMHFKFTRELCDRRTYCATCAFVRIIPRGSIITPLAVMGCMPVALVVQKMLTRAARAFSFTVSNGNGGEVYGFWMRMIVLSKTSHSAVVGGDCATETCFCRIWCFW